MKKLRKKKMWVLMYDNIILSANHDVCKAMYTTRGEAAYRRNVYSPDAEIVPVIITYTPKKRK